jgi:hypothetical protein
MAVDIERRAGSVVEKLSHPDMDGFVDDETGP